MLLQFCLGTSHHSPSLNHNGAGSEIENFLLTHSEYSIPCAPSSSSGTISKTSADGCNLLKWNLFQMIQSVFRGQLIGSLLFGLKYTWKETDLNIMNFLLNPLMLSSG